jgi:hypothetical protein
MYGLLHEPDGRPVDRHVRILKVGIGLPVGPDVHVTMTAKADKPWRIDVGAYDGKKRTGTRSFEFATKADAMREYPKIRKEAPERVYPNKFPYFTFLRLGIDGKYVHDFDAIEQNGPFPNEIEVVFITENPLQYAYQAWTAAELKCEGDGKNARRRVNWAQGEQQKKEAAIYEARGENFFPILNECFTGGCPFPKGDKPACKPHGRLFFQLTNSPRIGGSCTYDTTGFRSISQLFSCIQQIKAMTGGGDPARGHIAGIPLKLVLRPYKVSHNGQPSVQYGVSLEFRAANAIELARLLNYHSTEFRQAAQIIGTPALIESGAYSVEDVGEVEPIEKSVPQEMFPDEATEAAALNAEFYGDFDEEGRIDDDQSDQVKPEQFKTPKRRSAGEQAAEQMFNGEGK